MLLDARQGWVEVPLCARRRLDQKPLRVRRSWIEILPGARQGRIEESLRARKGVGLKCSYRLAKYRRVTSELTETNYLGDGVCLVIEDGVGQHVGVLTLEFRPLLLVHPSHLFQQRLCRTLGSLTSTQSEKQFASLRCIIPGRVFFKRDRQ